MHQSIPFNLYIYDLALYTTELSVLRFLISRPDEIAEPVQEDHVLERNNNNKPVVTAMLRAHVRIIFLGLLL